MVGIDVGEDFLDIAALTPKSRYLRLTRIDLRNCADASAGRSPRSNRDKNAVSLLATMLTDKVCELRGAIALVDSPRWPSDLDWSKRGMVAATHPKRGREIDVRLRALVVKLRELGAPLPLLAMFPTPPMRYFGAHLNAAACKAHLRMFGEALFGDALNRDYGPASGGIFTRFMIAGFATYRALEAIGAKTYECYPDLQFRLWRRHHQLVAKNSPSGKTAALASRIRVLSALARRLGVCGFPPIQRLDEADAAILALSIIAGHQHGATLVLENPCEGRFVVAMDEAEAKLLHHVTCVTASTKFQLSRW